MLYSNGNFHYLNSSDEGYEKDKKIMLTLGKMEDVNVVLNVEITYNGPKELR